MLPLLSIEAPELVANLAIAVVAAAIFGSIARRVGLVSIVGYILAGVIIGPEGLAIIEDPDLVSQMAEIGVIFLMFFIGLEMSPELVKKVGPMMFSGGTAQIVGTCFDDFLLDRLSPQTQNCQTNTPSLAVPRCRPPAGVQSNECHPLVRDADRVR